MKIINVALASDENYFQPLSVTMTSILKNANRDELIHFFVLCNNVKDELKTKLFELKKLKDCTIKFIDLDNKSLTNFSAGKEGCHITKTAYARIFLPEIVKNEEKIIYLDCDIVVKSSLWELFDTDIKDYYIGAVEDIGCTCLHKLRPDINPYDYFYINTGVLLINLEKWREDNIVGKILEAERLGYSKFQQDQELINVVCHEKCLPLDMSWNVQDSFYRDDVIVKTSERKKNIKYASKHPNIIHYTASAKPWNYVYIPKANDWWYYNKVSPLKRKITVKQKLEYILAKMFVPMFSYKNIYNKKMLRIFGIKITINKKNR